jgi:hypothetical protein
MDALIVVNLLDMPASHLERYCGREGAERIRRYGVSVHDISMPENVKSRGGAAIRCA